MKRWIHAAKEHYDYDEYSDIARAAIKSTDPNELREYAQSKYPEVRRRTALNEYTSGDVLRKLAQDGEYEVREGVASNKNAPIDAIIELADDPSSYVREHIVHSPSGAYHRKLPLSIYNKLLSDEDEDVRWAAAYELKYGYGDYFSKDDLLKLLKDKAIENKVWLYIREFRPEIDLDSITKTKKVTWKSFLSKLDNELENGDDPLYEQTEAGEHLQGLMQEVEEKLNLLLEPSIQAGMGGMFIYQNDEEVAEVDYQDFNSDAIGIALNSRSKADFKKKYKAFLESLI